MKRRLKINGLVMFLATIILAIFPAVFFRKYSSGAINIFAEIFGITFILLGQLIRVSARGFKSDNSKNGSGLVKAGPYSLVRNPMYLGIILIGFGAVLMFFRPWAIIIFLCFFAVRYVLLIHKEERKLKLLFSKEYANYCKDVPHRLFPSLNELLDRGIYEYLPLKLKWVRKEIGSIVGVLSLVILVEAWEDLRYGGFQVYLMELTGLAATFILFICLAVYLISFSSNQNAADKSKNNS